MSSSESLLVSNIAPLRLVLDINEACNIRCSYCHIDALFGGSARNSRLLPAAAVVDAIRTADQMRIFDITITGGEPTIAPTFKELIPHFGTSFSSVQVITNGTKLTPSTVEKLADSGLARISVSIDALGRSHDLARGDGTFERAWSGLQNALSAGLIVNVITVLGSHNLHDWESLSRRLRDIGVRSHNVSLMCRLGRAESASSWQGVPQQDVSKVLRKAKELGAELNSQDFFFYFNDALSKSAGWSGEPTPIHAFQDANPGIQAVIKVDGSVIHNRIYGIGRPIGNVNTSGLSEIWRLNAESRSDLASIVGSENVGRLSELYYHFDEFSSTDSVNSALSQSSSDARVRVRDEPWGRMSFDTETFSLVGFEAK